MGSLKIKNAAGVEYDLLLANTTPSVVTIPRLVYTVYGDSTDGGTTPDATTQASINGLLALGVPAANIRWLYVVDSGTMVIQNIITAPTIDNVILTLADSLTISDIITAPTIENITLTSPATPAALIPALTGYTGTGVTVSAKTEDGGGTTQAWKAFDSSSSTFYAGSGEAGVLAPNRAWLKVVFATAKTITELQTTNIADNNLGYNAAVLEYSDTPSNDDISAWTTALSITGANVTTLRTYACTEPTAHTGWRLRYVSQLDGSSTFVYQLQQMQLIGY